MLETRLLLILKSHPWFMSALDAALDLGLPYTCIGGGAIRSIVFDYLEDTITPIKDIDVAYFDSTNLSKGDEYEPVLREQMPDIPWDVKNQASAHLWYCEKNVPAFRSIEEAISTWPETCTAVAVGSNKVYAPHGLEDLFSMIVRHNPVHCTVETYNTRVLTKQYNQRWKSVKIF